MSFKAFPSLSWRERFSFEASCNLCELIVSVLAKLQLLLIETSILEKNVCLVCDKWRANEIMWSLWKFQVHVDSRKLYSIWLSDTVYQNLEML